MLIASDRRSSRLLVAAARRRRSRWFQLRRALRHRLAQLRGSLQALSERLPTGWRLQRGAGLAAMLVMVLLAAGWLSTSSLTPPHDTEALIASLPGQADASQAATPASAAEPATPAQPAEPAAAATAPATESQVVDSLPAVVSWAPDRRWFERNPHDSLPVDPRVPVRLRVVTVRARVTAYTPYDHAETHPQWADGVVAWHPGGRRRHVAAHRYCLATDWTQFPPGATFIHVPGYMEETFSDFPERFRVVDDACGAARRARKRGQQPVIDVRYMTRHSAISGSDAWGVRELDVEVVFPQGFRIPASLRPWVVSDEHRTYYRGERID